MTTGLELPKTNSPPGETAGCFGEGVGFSDAGAYRLINGNYTSKVIGVEVGVMVGVAVGVGVGVGVSVGVGVGVGVSVGVGVGVGTAIPTESATSRLASVSAA